MKKRIERVTLLAQPPGTNECLELMHEVDPEAPFALFGGAVRDAHYAACHRLPSRLNDYDIRVWLPNDEHQARTEAFVRRLGKVSGSEIEHKPSAGPNGHNRIRYYFTMSSGIELDVSVRTPANTSLAVARVAIDRAGDADAGLSSVAIAPDGTAWATPEFEGDVENRTISMYPRPNSGDRLPEYAERMQAKFPDHEVIWL
jgi:hypothetical protein